MKKIYVIGIIAIIIFLMVQLPHAMINPGELVEPHQKLNDSCMACHAPFWGVSNEKCINCHKLADIGKNNTGKQETILFHSKLNQQECVSCHTDHKGKHPAVSFTTFNHSLLSVTDQEKCNSCHDRPAGKLHEQVTTQCANCHNTSGWTSNVTFNHDMIQGVDKTNCVSCHNKPNDDYHASFDSNCSQCHSTQQWIPSTFNHNEYFVLEGEHKAECKTCHNNNIFTSYTCYGCHEHSESKIREEHSEEGISNFSDCASCHPSGNEHDIRINGRPGRKNTGNEADQMQQYIQQQDGKNKNQSSEKDEDD
jgi:Class III cytochrome C family